MVTGTTCGRSTPTSRSTTSTAATTTTSTHLYDGTTPFRSSDHNPEIIGINAPDQPGPDRRRHRPGAGVQRLPRSPARRPGQCLGRCRGDGRGRQGPARRRTRHRLRDGGRHRRRLDVRVVHPERQADARRDERGRPRGLRRGQPRVRPGLRRPDGSHHVRYDAADPEGGANWPYIAANVRLGDANGAYALDTDRTDGNFANSNGATWWKDFAGLDGGDGITRRLRRRGDRGPRLPGRARPRSTGWRSPSIVDEVNAAADALKVDGCGGEPCDLVIELVHEGAPSPSCATIKTDTDVDLRQDRPRRQRRRRRDRLRPHPPEVQLQGRPWRARRIDRPVVSAGQYGSYLNQLEFDFAPGTDNLVGIRQHVLAMKDYDEDAATKAIVDDAVAVAAVEGAVELGQVEGPFKRARRIDTRPPATRSWRTVAASRPWATWSPRSSAGRPAPTSAS